MRLRVTRTDPRAHSRFRDRGRRAVIERFAMAAKALGPHEVQLTHRFFHNYSPMLHPRFEAE